MEVFFFSPIFLHFFAFFFVENKTFYWNTMSTERIEAERERQEGLGMAAAAGIALFLLLPLRTFVGLVLLFGASYATRPTTKSVLHDSLALYWQRERLQADCC